MADVEWLIAGGLLALGLALGLGIGLFISRKTGKVRDLQEQLQGAQSELKEYREQVVTQFSETARKFKTLNDAYSDLHQQLAESASALCGNSAGPLLEAPAGAEKLLIPAEATGETSTESSTESSTKTSAESEETAQVSEADADATAETLARGDEGPTEPTAETAAQEADATKSLEAHEAEGGKDIRVPEPDSADRSGNDEPARAQAPTEPRKYGTNP